MRKFEIVREDAIKYHTTDIKMPVRATLNSAGYDFFSPLDVTILPNTTQIIWTNVKFFCKEDEYLMICITSGMGKRGLTLPNGVGIIDADYYSNENNDGNIGFMLRNVSGEPYEIKKHDKIGQGIFMKYLLTSDDAPVSQVRAGGFGSTDKK